MKGLEIREVSIQDILKLEDYRLEAEFHISNKIEFDSVKGVEVESFSQYGTSKDLNENYRGFPVLRLNEFDSFFISKPAKCCDLIDFETYESIKIKKDDILICRTNGNPKLVGKAAIVPQDYEYAFASYLFRVRPNTDLINSSTLVTFLNSRYGRLEIEKYSMVGNQANFSPAKFRQISVPIFSKQFNDEIENLVYKSFNLSEESKKHYQDAVEILNSELGINDWRPNNAPVNIKQLKESFLTSGRLDAEYYQTKYEDYAGFIRKYKHGFDILGNVCSLNEKNFNPLDNTEYRYIELSNIGNSGEITGCTTATGAELPSRARRLVHTNDVIVSSIEGSLQSVALVTDEYDKAICSTGFHVVKSDTINPETLLVLFKSEPIQNLLKQGCSGTILTAIGRNELQNMVMPKIRNEVQTEIAEYVQKSISLRKDAKQLLENAKIQVEDAISAPPNQLIDNQLAARHIQMTEESTYYYRLAEWALLQELYAEIWITTTTANHSIKNYSTYKTSGRLDAEYYQPKYDELFLRLSKFECNTINDIAIIKKSIEPGSEAYQDSGIPFVRVSDVTKFGISEPNVFLSPNDFNAKQLQPKRGTILLSKDGSVGIAYKVEKDLDCITSSALLHLTVFNQDYTPDYLTLVLNSIVVQMQAERDSNGAIIQHWKPSEIKQVIIPKLPMPTQAAISAKIQKSFALKAESKRLLEEAKLMVERKIEKGGELNKNTCDRT